MSSQTPTTAAPRLLIRTAANQQGGLSARAACSRVSRPQSRKAYCTSMQRPLALLASGQIGGRPRLRVGAACKAAAVGVEGGLEQGGAEQAQQADGGGADAGSGRQQRRREGRVGRVVEVVVQQVGDVLLAPLQRLVRGVERVQLPLLVQQQLQDDLQNLRASSTQRGRSAATMRIGLSETIAMM